MNPLALHLIFRAAMRALIQDSVQSVGTEGHVNGDPIVSLPCKVIEGKGLLQQGIQLFHRFFFHFFRRCDALDMGADFDVADLEHVIQGISVEGALGDDGHHRNPQPLHQHTQPLGHGRGAAVKGISRLRIHQNAGLVFPQHILDVLDEGQIRHIFMGGGTPQQTHQLAQNTAHGIHRGHDAQLPGIKDAIRKLHIREAGMVHQNQTGLVLHQLHALGGVGELDFP